MLFPTPESPINTTVGRKTRRKGRKRGGVLVYRMSDARGRSYIYSILIDQRNVDIAQSSSSQHWFQQIPGALCLCDLWDTKTKKILL